MPGTTLPSPQKKPRPALENSHAQSHNLDDVRALLVLKTVRAFRDGDFTVRLPDDWGGVEGPIAEAFNTALAHAERIASEVLRLSVSVGKEGRLKQRMSVPGAIGAWSVKVDSLNTLLDDLVRPTTEI